MEGERITFHVSCHSYFMYFVYSEAISWQENFSPPHAVSFLPRRHHQIPARRSAGLGVQSTPALTPAKEKVFSTKVSDPGLLPRFLPRLLPSS